MDTKLIEALLIELLQLGRERFTPEKILANLTLAATAAGLSLTAEGAPLQREHMQLTAALDHMAQRLGDQYRVRAMLRLGGGLEGVELGAVIEPHDSTSPLPRFVAFGSSARSCLATLNREMGKAHQPKQNPAPPRRAGRLTLQRLNQQLATAEANKAVA